MNFLRIVAVSFLLAPLVAGTVAASEPPDTTRPNIHALRIDGNIPLTGDLNDPRWEAAQPVSLGYEAEPAENMPAPQMTMAKILYNSEYVYVGFDCSDTEPGAIRAHISERDKIFDDDFVILVLDTFGDAQRAYEFCVNPYGIQGDLMRTGNNEDESFDAVWESAAKLNGKGWTAVMAIPLKSLRFPSNGDQRWKLSLGRIYPRSSRAILSWTPLDRNNPCLQCQGGDLLGISGVQSVSSIELLPYLAAQQSGEVGDDSDPASAFVNGKPRLRAGGGLKYSPTPDLSVEAVINPDFSQIESDATQISVNSSFALSYPERRPFFLTGADLFNTMTGTFYSRAINNPLGGARVIGKSGALSYSYLAAVDRNTPYVVPGEEGSDVVQSDIQSYSNVARGRYDFGNESYLGGMMTARNSPGAHNYTGGVDGNWKFLGNNSVQAEVILSDTREVNDPGLFADGRRFGRTGHDAAFNGERYSGIATALALRHLGRDYGVNLQYRDRNATFQAQDGFVPGNDIRIVSLAQWYTFYPNNALIDKWTPEVDAGLHWNHDGTKKEQWVVPNFWIQFKGQIGFGANYLLVNDELFRGVQFRDVRRIEFNVNSRVSSTLSLNMSYGVGRFINRGDVPGLGTGHTFFVSAIVMPTSQLKIEIDYSRAGLRDVATGGLFFDGYIARTVCMYQFTPEFLVRMIGQYDQFSKKADLYPLLSYRLNPYTIFYIGSTYSLVDYGMPYGTRQTGRQYFLKIQYLWRT
jgi:hypothetical protein